MNTITETTGTAEATMESTTICLGVNCLPTSVVLSFIVMGLCIVLGGSLLI